MPAEKTELNPLGYKVGERACSTNPNNGGLAGMFEWNGGSFTLIKKGHLQIRLIGSMVELVLAAREVIKRGGLIEPCENVKDKRVIRCPYMDPTGLRHCTYEEGDLQGDLPKAGGGFECPKQRGEIKFIAIVG